MVQEVILKILVIFIIIAIGFAARKTNLVDESVSPALSSVLFNILTPCMVIGTMQDQEFNADSFNDTVWSFISYTLVLLIMGFLSFAMMKLLKIKESERGIYRIQVVFTNIGFMGIPLTKVIFGDEAEFIILIMNIAYVVLLYSFGVFLLLYKKGEKAFDAETAKKMLNLPLICSVIGFVLYLTGWRLPDFVNESINLIGDTVVPVSMFIIGVQLCDSSIKRLLNKENIMFAVLSLIVIPVMTLGIGVLLPQSDMVTLTLVFGMAMPSGAMCAILAEQFDKDMLLASEGVAITTFFSLISLPVWAIVLSSIFL